MISKNILLSGLFIALVACNKMGVEEAKADEVGEGSSKVYRSEFRPNVKVGHLYTQFLGQPYSSAWRGRLEKSDRGWRDVYVETNEKLTAKGIISFNCDGNLGEPVGWISYWSEFGDESERSIVQIHGEDWQDWQLDNLVDDNGDPQSVVPYEVYVVSHSKYC